MDKCYGTSVFGFIIAGLVIMDSQRGLVQGMLYALVSIILGVCLPNGVKLIEKHDSASILCLFWQVF
jgi:hypothetical protein